MAVFPSRDQIVGGILAGGEGRRMGGCDKGWVAFAGRPLIEHVLSAVRPQVGRILISANRNLAHYGHWNDPVVADEGDGFRGPMAGVRALWMASHERYIQIVPVDAARLPPDLVSRLGEALDREGAAAAIARADEREHYTCCLIDRAAVTDPPPCSGSLGAWLGGLDSVSVPMPAGTILSVNSLAEMEALA